MNGMNGAGMPGGGGMSMPTPAGHQAELNYIYSMVEELSKQLADNRKAKTNGISNGELLDAAADELQGALPLTFHLLAVPSQADQSLCAAKRNSTPYPSHRVAREAKHSRDQNATLLTQYATPSPCAQAFHEYNQARRGRRRVASVYRTQLDEARRENSRLREQIWEMQTHAATANESLRKFRSNVAAKQEIRFWKRMAMPELEDDDTYWSGDDDLIDRPRGEAARLEQRAAQEQMMAESQAEDSDGGPQQSRFSTWA
ncbi:unnamed protein product, partial [Clonostachys rosea f. rosea IK726]